MINSKLVVIIAGVVLLSTVLLFEKKSPPSENSIQNIQSASETVPLPRPEDYVINFFNLIDEDRIPAALDMMIGVDDETKQSWGVQFAAFEKIQVKKIEPAGVNLYKVTLNVAMKPESADEIIPYFGYTDGDNTRWVSVEKSGQFWKITGINTGP